MLATSFRFEVMRGMVPIPFVQNLQLVHAQGMKKTLEHAKESWPIATFFEGGA
eukprot:CAMPEP_0116069046 /NCGR_PEP_ID=MMETSP0322-20121206/12039_1 /TAXON_ID=163516 /ORGANISM="Leptocylindrus danicus var. apora, Strain B651" /LENGTH=52 /DNA_ID=CAMNT_0003556305 /DNA_START=740 /DNA_END=898 /DNA_ORIENTATION=+